MKIAVQGFSVRDELKKDLPGTIRSLKGSGFEAYEMGVYFRDADPRVVEGVEEISARLGGLPGSIWSEREAVEKMKAIRDQGLLINSAHLFLVPSYEQMLTDSLDDLIRFAKANDLQQYAISYRLESWEAAEAVLPRLRQAGEALEAEGLRLAYHNHDTEMAPAGGSSILERLLDTIATLSLQPDTGWMAAGGGSVSHFLTRYADRIHSIHLKDLLLNRGAAAEEIVCTPIGRGDVDHRVLGPLLSSMPLMEGGLIIDQDNARGTMLEELALGLAYINHELVPQAE